MSWPNDTAETFWFLRLDPGMETARHALEIVEPYLLCIIQGTLGLHRFLFGNPLFKSIDLFNNTVLDSVMGVRRYFHDPFVHF